MAVFQDFFWDTTVKENNSVVEFKKINILYGRNYSGKTTLSRLLRALETGELSDKYENPSFEVVFADGTIATQASLKSHGKKIRVFNEDFVRENLRFITNPDDSIEPFAILGDDNNKIEKEIEALESELGSSENGKETGLYAQKIQMVLAYNQSVSSLRSAKNTLEEQLTKKATDRTIGIKYQSDRFGDQNYTISKLKNDIDVVQADSYQALTDEQVKNYEALIAEKTLNPIEELQSLVLNFSTLCTEAKVLVTKPISESNKIEVLVKDALLHKWVKDGLDQHKGKHDNCAFCGNPISKDRWAKLEKHFDEESAKLETDIAGLLKRIDTEKNILIPTLSMSSELFYSEFKQQLNGLSSTLADEKGKYIKALTSLEDQLKARKEDILNQKPFSAPEECAKAVEDAWAAYSPIIEASNTYSTSLQTKQNNAKKELRLKEVSDFLSTIGYREQTDNINRLESEYNALDIEKKNVEQKIQSKKQQILSLKRQLNDEEKGAEKVNEYLNNFFGHQFLSLQATQINNAEEGSKRIRFEVIRNGQKAYHLSEGECSLLAFCYFMAKLSDTQTKNSESIIWIDDPISSLDSNHIFFIFSLISQEIVNKNTHSQLFISTHNLDFLKFLKRLPGAYKDEGKNQARKQYQHFVLEREHNQSLIRLMPNYLKNYITEFNYLFHQIYKCSSIKSVDDSNYTTFYNFGNNARKFFEIYLYYKYPDQGMTEQTLSLFFGNEKIPAILTGRINNEFSHLCGLFERGATPVLVPEMLTSAKLIIERLKEDKDQFDALLKSIGEQEPSLDVDDPATKILVAT